MCGETNGDGDLRPVRQCGINVAHYTGSKPTWLRIGFWHDLSFSTLVNILRANTQREYFGVPR